MSAEPMTRMDANELRRPTVVVQHPDPVVRTGLEAVLRREEAFVVLDAGSDVGAADRPYADVLITDYDHALRLAARRSDRTAPARTGLVVLTANDREGDVRRAVSAGVDGYLLQGGSLSELFDAVAQVAAGGRYLCRSAAQRAAESLTREPLTSREIDVLSLVATGESNKAIARRLNIEPATVKTHMTAIMSKLGASSRTHAAGVAATLGLVQPPPLLPTVAPRAPARAVHAGRATSAAF